MNKMITNMSFLKRTLLGVVVLLTACASNVAQAQSSQTDWEEYDLKGCVKQLTIKTFRAHIESGTPVKDDLWSTAVIEFSLEGKLLQVERIGESKNTYTYTKTQKITNCFSADNNLTSRIVTTYTKWGAIKRIVYYNASGTETGRVDYTYDAKRQLVERLHQTISDPYTREEGIQFDAVGHEIRCERYDKENRLREIETSTYDVEGRKIMNEVSRYEGGAYAYGVGSRYTYNQEGFISMVESAADMGEYQVTHILTYVYDSHGNYVTKNNMNDRWPFVEERTIQYY